MGIGNYVDVAITLATAAISQAGFGTLLILTTQANASYGADLIRSYEDIDGVAADWASTDAAYKAAQAAFSADPKPAKLKIALADAPVAGAGAITFAGDFVADNTVSVTVNGTATSVVSTTDSATTLGALATALAARDDIASATADTLNKKITLGGELGYPLTVGAIAVTGGASQTTGSYAESTPPVTLPDGLGAVVEVDNDWYGLALADLKTKANILNVAAWVEARVKIFGACNNDADVLAGTAGNVLLKLVAAAYGRTFYLYSDTPGSHPEAEWAAQELAEEPGSATWMFKKLPGITADVLTSTERGNVLDNKGNVYTTQGGVNMTEPGVMASGQFIDIIHGRDWLEARLAEDVFGLLVKAKKVPYTNKGAGLLEAEVRKRLKLAVDAGVLSDDEEFTVTVPKVADQATNDRANRYFPGLKFDATLAGAIHKAQIRGTVSV